VTTVEPSPAPGERRRRSYNRGTAENPQRRRWQYGVRVSGEEREALEERAQARGVSVARLMVDSALERPLPESQPNPSFAERLPYYEILDGLQRELGRVGNNVNQLARHANTSGEMPTAERLEVALEEARAAIRAVQAESVRLSQL
jgi:hypothetical protein